MHGHYAGRDFPVVVNLLDSIAANFRFVEALEISHCDGKPLNFVIDEVDGEKITKTIDFDASADYGKNYFPLNQHKSSPSRWRFHCLCISMVRR